MFSMRLTSLRTTTLWLLPRQVMSLPSFPPQSAMPANALPASNMFENTEVVARYAEGPKRMVPGYLDMLQMTGLMLQEKTALPSIEKGDEKRILVVGARGWTRALASCQRIPQLDICGG